MLTLLSLNRNLYVSSFCGGYIFPWGKRLLLKKKRSGQPGGPCKCAITIEQSIWPIKVKGIKLSVHFTKAYSIGGVAHSLVSLALDGGKLSASCPRCCTTGERTPHNHWIGWVGSRANLDIVEKAKISYFCWDLNLDHSACSLATKVTNISTSVVHFAEKGVLLPYLFIYLFGQT